MFAVGINELAASFAGIRVGAVRLAVYGSSGLLTGIASLIYASRVFSDRGDSGTGLELLAIAAVVVGGASIRGGEISVARTTLAVIVIGVIPDGLQLAGIDTSWQYVTIGVVMVTAIVINELFARRASTLWSRAPWRKTEMEDTSTAQPRYVSWRKAAVGVALLLPVRPGRVQHRNGRLDGFRGEQEIQGHCADPEADQRPILHQRRPGRQAGRRATRVHDRLRGADDG